jgi:hypothetical protein
LYFRALGGPVFLSVKIDLTFFDLLGIIKVKQHLCGHEPYQMKTILDP